MTRPNDAAEAAALWMAHMRSGHFEAAWNLNDALRRAGLLTYRTDIPRHLQTVWDGSPIDGRRVLVRCYHGLGDTIQFIRYAPLLRPRVAQLIVWAQPTLVRVLSPSMPEVTFVALHDGDPEVAHDVGLEIMELPYLFRTTVDTIPRDVPYLDVAGEPLERSNGPAVGLVWRAGDWAAHRSIPFPLLEPLVSMPASWYVLQGAPGIEERPPAFGIAAGTNDLEEAARVIRSLDLLITIDSMPAHLAGALGTPVWTLLSAEADWRWMEARDDCPWYPTMRLFRQRRQGDWKPLVADVAHALDRFLERRRTAAVG